jgi:hypothetical protein
VALYWVLDSRLIIYGYSEGQNFAEELNILTGGSWIFHRDERIRVRLREG